jgi:hypothetical protein
MAGPQPRGSPPRMALAAAFFADGARTLARWGCYIVLLCWNVLVMHGGVHAPDPWRWRPPSLPMARARRPGGRSGLGGGAWDGNARWPGAVSPGFRFRLRFRLRIRYAYGPAAHASGTCELCMAPDACMVHPISAVTPVDW